MNIKTYFQHRQNLAFFVVVCLWIVLAIFVKSSFFRTQNQLLGLGVTFDFLISIPIIYLLLVQKAKIDKFRLLQIFYIGFLLCYLLLPKSQQQFVNLFRIYVIPILELFLLSVVIIQIKKIRFQFKLLNNEKLDFFDKISKVLPNFLPELASKVFINEIAVIYYCFISREKTFPSNNHFSYHKNTGTIALLWAIVGIILIETFAIHLIINKFSTSLAILLSLLSFYTILQLVAIIKSIKIRPIILGQNELNLRYGIVSNVKINYKNISEISYFSKEIEKNGSIKKLSIFVAFESHNILLKLHEPCTITGIYGINYTTNKIVFFVDDPQMFLSQITAKI